MWDPAWRKGPALPYVWGSAAGRAPFASPHAGEGASTVLSTESPKAGVNPRSEQPCNRNPRGLQAEIVQPRDKNATLSSSQILRCSCCQNLYEQITLLSGIQQETEREKSPAWALWRHTRNIPSNAAISLTYPDIWGIQKKNPTENL